MTTPSIRTVDELKIAGHMFAAGALSRQLGLNRNYGCHLGMRSTLERDRAEFHRGFDAV